MFCMFRFCNIGRGPMFQKYTTVETLDNISMTCVVEAWCYHFCWFLCNLFRPSDKSFTLIHRTSHMFIVWCPCCIDFRISFTNITVITATVLLSSSKCECCLERNWFPKKSTFWRKTFTAGASAVLISIWWAIFLIIPSTIKSFMFCLYDDSYDDWTFTYQSPHSL